MRPIAGVLVVLVSVVLAGCLASGPPTQTDGEPDEAPDPAPPDAPAGSSLPATLGGFREVATVQAPGRGAGMWIDEAEGILYSARLQGGLWIYDLSDPSDVRELGHVGSLPDDRRLFARDVDVMHRGNRTYAILAGEGQGVHVVDVTTPDRSRVVATTDAWPSHNVAVVPGTSLVYNAHEVAHTPGVAAPDKVDGPVVPVLDLSNVTEPAWTTFPIPPAVAGVPTTSDGCHDVTVRVDLGRAFCAGGGEAYGQGGGETFIWDLGDDPARPAWLGVVDHPAIVYHHQAIAGPDGTVLLVGDESFAPNCNVGPTGTVQQPTGAVWVFDVSDPARPRPLSYVQADRPQTAPTCGSHFGGPVGDRNATTWGWYDGGTVLIDFEDPTRARIVDRAATSAFVWDARQHGGHVYASGEGIQVLEIVAGTG